MNIVWYVKRFFAMSPHEVLFRALFFIKKQLWKQKAQKRTLFCASVPVRDFKKPDANYSLPSIDSTATKDLIAEANLYLKHSWTFFGLFTIEPVINWHFDPTTNITSPQKYSFSLNHRNDKISGDVKVVWEKNRHQHLTVLCAAFAVSGDEKYALEAVTQILDWIEKNPCLIGINWTHPLELGIRLISWVWCERLLRKSLYYDKLFCKESPLWLCIGQHQEVIAKTYSQGSSANNHLIGEMAGLYIASTAFPMYRKSIFWQTMSKNILEKEIIKQTFESGLNREMAFEYHLFVTEFFTLALHESNRINQSFSQSYCTILKSMLNAVSPLTDYGRNLPHYGDGDDGRALMLYQKKHAREVWLLQLGSLLVSSTYPYTDETALPLFFMGYNADFPKLPPQPQAAMANFSDAGLYVLSRKRNTPQEIFVLADAGPLGFLSLAAHGHADALSFCLSAGGKQLFVDPGTYTYFGPKTVRNYFRSTQAHNTIMIDNTDQSKMQGTFLWSDKATTTVTDWQKDDTTIFLSAYHNGYKKSLGCGHKRSFALSENVLTIEDSLQGENRHDVCLCFHLAPDCTLMQESPNQISIVNNGVSATLHLPDNVTVTICKGEQNAGWFSPGFGIKVPSYSILAKTSITLPALLKTHIEVTHEC